jgi:hypothetical protein
MGGEGFDWESRSTPAIIIMHDHDVVITDSEVNDCNSNSPSTAPTTGVMILRKVSAALTVTCDNGPHACGSVR